MTDDASSHPAAPRPSLVDLVTLLIAISLLASASALIRWLQIEAPLMVDVEAISFCNVLFVGNLAAGCVTLLMRRPRNVWADLTTMPRSGRGLLALNSLFAMAIPMLLFSALQHTSVTNLILLGRFESIAFAVCGLVLFRQSIALGNAIGFAIIGIGITTLVLIEGMGQFGRGETLVIVGATLQGIAAHTSRINLRHGTLLTFVFVRNFVSAAVFFVVGSWLYGLEHFADAFGPRLWVVMSVYALIVIVLGQLAWYRSLDRLRPATIANVAMLSPVVGVAVAAVLLGERPSIAHWVGGGVILVGMAVPRFFAKRATPPANLTGPERSLAAG